MEPNIIRPLFFDEKINDFVFANIVGHEHGNYLLQKNKIKYSKEDIHYLYNTHIYNNIKNILDLEYFEFRWLHPRKIRVRHDQTQKFWDEFVEDKYLMETINNKKKLGLDILENGTYWPLVIANRMPHDELFIYEGNHRLYSIQLLVDEGIWPEDKKLLCLEVKRDYFPLKSRRDLAKVERKIKQAVPFVVLYGDRNNTDEIKKILEEKYFNIDNVKFYDDRKILLEIEAKYYADLLFFNQAIPHWMRDILWDYKNRTGEMIKPHKIINDEKEWNNFVEEVS
jgi:hypothetical protein